MPKSKLDPNSLYFVGIKGAGMAALASIAAELGYQVQGSDVADKYPTEDQLIRHQIKVFQGFNGDNIATAQPGRIVASAAYSLDHPELKAAKKARIPIIYYSQFLGEILAKFESIGVSGVHGKTTTTSMLATILETAGLSPSFLVGVGQIFGFDSPGRLGKGRQFVVEADEYARSPQDKTAKFLDLPLKHLILTSIELDHPDIYDSAEAVYDTFYQLTTKIPRTGQIVACTDYPLVRRLISRLADRRVVTYGFSASATWRIRDFRPGQPVKFILSNGQLKFELELNVPGKVNALNAAAAALIAHQLSVSAETIKEALAKFRLPKRRFEHLGQLNGAEVYDDYAHHPTAIKQLIETAREQFPDRRLVLVFQPHTFSRTAKLLNEFVGSLLGADELVILNIFASAREKSGYVSIRDLLEPLSQQHQQVSYQASLEEAAKYLQETITKDDVLVMAGAGDVYKIFSHFTS